MNVVRSIAAVAGGLALSALLSACVVAPARPYYGEAVVIDPPTPRVEVIGVAPGPGFFWVGGYWGWAGGRYVWMNGHWESHRPGYRWVPHAWVRQSYGWHEAPGHWQRR